MAVAQTQGSEKETVASTDFLLTEVTTLRELIDARAEATPEASYLLSPETGRAVHYRGLQGQARTLVARLQELGLSAGDKVAFLMDNGLFTAELFLGVMYGGMVAVPLNVRAGVSQLAYMAEHCDAKVVFVAAEYAALMSEVLAHVRRSVRVIPADVDEVIAVEGTTVPKPPLAVPGPEDTALLMYTSGSTGNPKGAVHTHRTLLAHGRNSVCSHQLTATDRSLLVLPLYHINAECVTLIPTLLSGGSVVIPHKFSISHYWDWLEKYHCTWSAIVPTIVSQLLDWQDPRADQRGPAFQRIRFLRSSSAPLAPSLHREFLQKFPMLLIQAMGSSEGGNIFSNPLPPGENKIGSPGLPWGFEVRVVDREGQEVAAGQPGEMLIRGEGLAHSYYKEPEATAAAFDAEGWWHTGDLAYRDADGYFFVVGRSKELIIKGGVNIAPRQVDDVLESHPAVLEAAAVGVPDRLLGEDVVAFVVLRAGAACEERELLSFCEARLGHFKTPTRIHFVEDLPKGPSGKVQRLRLVEEATRPEVALRIPQGFALGRGSDRVEEAATLPASLEATIGAIWAELLKVPEVGEHDNFFALGGDSLLAIQCVSRLRDKVAIRLTLTDFFAHGTVAELAALVKARYAAGHGADRLAAEDRKEGAGVQPRAASAVEGQSIPRRTGDLSYPLSPLQERLWFMEQLNPDVPVYNEAEAVRLTGELNVEALEGALNGVIARHEILRTTIRTVDGVVTAVPLESHQLCLKRIDLRGLGASEREAELARLLTAEPRNPYRLEEAPAIRATLIRLGSSEHVFILMMHHLICDWSSQGVLWRDMSALYRGFLRGEAQTLPELPIQHGDYAVWQRQQLTEASAAEDLAYWVENLRGAPPLLDLPSDRPRPQVMSYRGARKRFRLHRTLTEALRRLSREEKRSLFAWFTAALDVLLYRYTGQEDILLGVPISERYRPELGCVIGFLLHTHVLRTELSGDMTIRELTANVQQRALRLYEHRSVPFDQVVRTIHPERNASYSPLFQVMVNWRDREQHLCFIGLDGLEVESLLVDSQISKFDLTLFLTDMGEEIWAEIEYSTDLFDAGTIERMFGHYEKLLESIVAGPDEAIGKMEMLTAAERSRLLVEWNNTQAEFPRNTCIHELFEQQAVRTPDSLALCCGGCSLTYRELDERANRLAHHLRKMGVGPNTLVGLSMKRSVELVMGLLAILKAGAAYVPLDPSYPSERLAFILEDSRASVLLTQKGVAASLPRFGGQIVCVDDGGLHADTQEVTEDQVGHSPDSAHSSHLCYVIYTSGSTGKPKGVEIRHQAVVNFLSCMRMAPGLSAADTLLSVTTLSFDIFGLEIWLPLTTGAKVVIAPDGVARDGKELAALIALSGATVMQATPSTWRLLLESGWEGQPNLKILCGGEAWSEQLAEQLLPKCAELWNMYGPTETAIWSSAQSVKRGESVVIGHPLANTQFYVVDTHLQPVPVGVAGELLIGGEGLARGYWGQPKLTSTKFIPDPFRTEAASRLYRTGDLVRYRPDGTLKFLSRIDHQVKIRGFRVELGEVESVLREHPAISEAVVVIREDREKQLVAYVVAATGAQGGSAEWSDYLRPKLPDHMIPAAWVVLPALPLTPNGKVDRKALPAPSGDAYSRRGYAPPRGETETSLAHLWCEVLKLDRVGRYDDFFEVGGHSLLALSLIARINRSLGRNLKVSALFLHPTLESIAAVLDQETDAPKAPHLIRLRPGRTQGTLFFLDASIGMCRLASLLEEGPASLAVEPPFTAEILQAVNERHSAHRLTLQDFAAPLLPLIEGEQISAPCVLVAFCFGGAVAFELAHQLKRNGTKVDMIVLLDSWRLAPRVSQRLRLMTGDRLRGAVNRRLEFVRNASSRLARRLLGRNSSAEQDLLLAEEAPYPIPRPVTTRVRRDYEWRPLEARGLLVRARDQHFARLDSIDGTRGWGGLFKGGLEIAETPGDHGAFLGEGNIGVVGRILQQSLAKLIKY